MPPKYNPKPQDITPATFAAIRPGTPVVPLNPQEEEALNDVARQHGVNTADAMRKVAESLPQPPQRQTVTEQSLTKLAKAREMGLTDDDKNDPLNQMMRYGFYKDLKKDMKGGDTDKMSPRDMMEMNMVNMQLLIMQRSMGGDSQGGTQQILAEMKAENERQRLYYEQKLKEQDEKIRDMIFEKRIQTMEDDHAETANRLSQQLTDINKRIELYRNIPVNPSPEEKSDAISNLEILGGQIDRIKKALAPFGIVPASPLSPGLSGPMDTYRKPDGSTDYFKYTVDKLENTIGKVAEAWQKKTPEMKQVAKTPHEPRQKEATYRQISPEEYFEILVNKPVLTPEEQAWLDKYNTYLESQRKPVVAKKAYTEPEQQPSGVAEQQCRMCGSPEVYMDGLCGLCYTSQNTEQQPAKKSVLDRLREQEEEEMRRTGGIM